MKRFTDLFARGINFAKDNPQIIYTLFLVFAIPLAFFFSSEQFLSVARENQDKLEQSRISLLEDSFAAFIPALSDPEEVLTKLQMLANENETINGIDVITATSTIQGEQDYRYFASLAHGTSSTAYVPDAVADDLLHFSRADASQSYAMTYSDMNGRHWRSVRSIRVTGFSEAYVIVDVSMAESDAIAQRNIRNAYGVLVLIIIMIIILLARQARIIDYSVLYTRLKQVDQMKDDFVSMAAHELRSPLTVIRGYVEMLGEGEGLKDAGKLHLKNIDLATERLNGLIGDILDVAKLQEGRMPFTPVEVNPDPIVEGIIEGYMQPAHAKSLTLTYEKQHDAKIFVDPERFHQIVVNLVGNAVKYTTQGKINVIAKVDAGRYVLRVSDTGIGISAENQKHLFEKFYRVKNEATSRIQGTGLGLWITLAMVSAMNGKIAVESIEGKGSDFIVSWKVSE
jgi:signal transduction histidine kinase